MFVRWPLHLLPRSKTSRARANRFFCIGTVRGVAEKEIDSDEVECIVANLIAKKYIKGYISHSAQKLVRLLHSLRSLTLPLPSPLRCPLVLPCGRATHTLIACLLNDPGRVFAPR